MSKAIRTGVPTIRLTGERRDEHFQVDVLGKTMQLTHGLLEALIELVIACGGPTRGFVPISRVTIRRLRRALEGADRLAAKGLVETGCAEEYRLAIPKERLRQEIAVDSSFFELVKINAVSQEQAEQLVRVGHMVKPGRNRKETRRKPKRNRKETER